MDDQRNQGRDRPPQQGGQNGWQQQGAQDNPPQQGGQNGRQQQGAQDNPPQRGGHNGRRQQQPQIHPRQQGVRGPSSGIIDPERMLRVEQWRHRIPPPPAVNPRGQGPGYPGQGIGRQPHFIGGTLAGNGQPPNFLPAVPPGNQLPMFNNASTFPANVARDPRSFAPFNQLPPRPSVNNGAGVPNAPQPGQQAVQHPMLYMPAGNSGNIPGSGAARNQGQLARAQGNFQPRNPAPSNAAYPVPANIQQPSGEQPPRRRPARGGPPGGQPPAKRPKTGGSASNQPANNNTAPRSMRERLDNDEITDVAGLTRAEEDEIILWAHEQGMRWAEVQRRFKFTCALPTLRGRHRNLSKAQEGIHLKRKPEFTARDDELLLEAVEELVGGHLDDVDNHKVTGLWKKVEKYIRENGGQTTAGTKSLKKRYMELTENMAGIREDLEPTKAKWNHKEYENYSVSGQEEASFDDGAEEEPAGKPDKQGGGGNKKKPNKPKWDHTEYEKYSVEHEEGADFGETEEGEADEDNEGDDDYSA